MENSFINYFDKETEIYKGMKKIDDELGGTTPLNVILKFPKKKIISEKNQDDDLDDWDNDSESENKSNIGLLEIKWIKLLKFMII